jgi:hypothetical protein
MPETSVIRRMILRIQDEIEWAATEYDRPWWLWRLVGPLVRSVGKHYGMDCPHCGWSGFDFYEDPWFIYTKGGSYSGPDGTVHWFMGIQQCPRCRFRWEVDASD